MAGSRGDNRQLSWFQSGIAALAESSGWSKLHSLAGMGDVKTRTMSPGTGVTLERLRRFVVWLSCRGCCSRTLIVPLELRLP